MAGSKKDFDISLRCRRKPRNNAWEHAGKNGEFMTEKMYNRNIVLILAASFCYMACPMLITPLIVGFSESVGAAAVLTGIIGGLMNMCSIVCRPVVGNLTDRFSKYRIALIGAILTTVACIGYIVAEDPVLIVISRIVNGVGFSCCSVCMSTWLSNMLPRNKIGSGMGLYGMMNALAMAVAPAIGVWVYQAFGYHAAFCVALAFAIATGMTIQFISDKGEPMTSVQPEASRAEVLEPVGRKKLELVDRRVLPITAIIMLFAIPYCATQSFIVSYTETRDIAVSVGLFFPIYAIILLVLRMVMKGSFDRLPFKVFLIGSSVCAFCGIGLLAVMENNVLMFLAAAFMAGGYGIMCSVCQSTAILLARRGKRGLANSTYYIGLDLGMTLGPVIGGFLYGHLDISMFYPMLAVTVPLIIIVYIFSRKGLEPKNF